MFITNTDREMSDLVGADKTPGRIQKNDFIMSFNLTLN